MNRPPDFVISVEGAGVEFDEIVRCANIRYVKPLWSFSVIGASEKIPIRA